MADDLSKRARQVELKFSRRKRNNADQHVYHDLSAVAHIGDTLFLACDETASLERLRRVSRQRFGDHLHLSLADLVELPAGAVGEMDIEGLCADEGFLWIVGSHSLKRRKPKRGENGTDEALARMEKIKREPNRYFLGRIPLVEEMPGLFRPCSEVGERRPAWIRFTGKTSALMRWLASDPLLGPFLTIPAKENGFDVEGIAARGDRVWLGLRGPVLGGHAAVLELVLKEKACGRLMARRLEGKRRYRKHLLDTAGLGIRDMRLDGDDLLLLVGPTMSLDGPAYVLRWVGAAQAEASGVVDPARIETVVELPYELHVDHPEGLDLWSEEPRSLLVIYDAPAPERVDSQKSVVRADLLAI
ncbi:MAG TPA: DUF3616 domain-containing protein [Propylenella sp.]|nr:DUF3616 domain-containing protein [Propylenella sp.]